jgi:hypothetical protein
MEAIAVQVAVGSTRRVAHSALPGAPVVEGEDRRIVDAVRAGLSSALRGAARRQVRLAARIAPRPLPRAGGVGLR